MLKLLTLFLKFSTSSSFPPIIFNLYSESSLLLNTFIRKSKFLSWLNLEKPPENIIVFYLLRVFFLNIFISTPLCKTINFLFFLFMFKPESSNKYLFRKIIFAYLDLIDFSSNIFLILRVGDT